jgi:hypothetical protein
LDGPNGYKAFAREWNHEVSQHFKAWSTGDDEVQQLWLKKWEYLADYYDKLEGHKALNATAPKDDCYRKQLDETLRENWLQLPAVPRPFQVKPVVFKTDGITPFATPTVLNNAITVNAVTGANHAATGMLHGRLVAPYQVFSPLLTVTPPPPRRQTSI